MPDPILLSRFGASHGHVAIVRLAPKRLMFVLVLVLVLRAQPGTPTRIASLNLFKRTGNLKNQDRCSIILAVEYEYRVAEYEYKYDASSSLNRTRELTLDHINSQSASRGFFVFGLHVASGFAHRADDFVERYEMVSITSHG